jgi:uncharacterized membrane protein YraQ (UPF0718 family)
MNAAPATSPTASRVSVGGLLLLGTFVSALFYYKWGASLRVVSGVQATGKLAVAPGAILEGGVVATTLAYFGKIWPALTYGILVGAAVRAAIPARTIRRWLGGRGATPTLAGAIAGAPLMLCSCCITPIFSGLYQRGARLGPSMAVMLASPGFNLGALVLTFALLPAQVGVARLVAALAIVLGLSAAIGRSMGDRSAPDSARRDVVDGAEPEPQRHLLLRFVRSAAYLAVITVPLIVVGVLLSGLVLPHVGRLAGASLLVAVALAALVGTLAALPTFFEIPIALMLLSLGAPLPVVAAFVVAGPVVNLPSLLVLAREVRPRVALALGAGVWLVATVTGLATAI